MTREEDFEELDFVQPHKTVGKLISVKVLDKIRAEIMQLDYDTENVDYDYNDMVQTEVVHTIYREEVLRIIDEYKAEMESEE